MCFFPNLTYFRSSTAEQLVNTNLKWHSRTPCQCRWLGSWTAGLQTVSILTKLHKTQGIFFSNFTISIPETKLYFSTALPSAFPNNTVRACSSWGTELLLVLLLTPSVYEHTSYQMLVITLHFSCTNTATEILHQLFTEKLRVWAQTS